MPKKIKIENASPTISQNITKANTTYIVYQINCQITHKKQYDGLKKDVFKVACYSYNKNG